MRTRIFSLATMCGLVLHLALVSDLEAQRLRSSLGPVSESTTVVDFPLSSADFSSQSPKPLQFDDCPLLVTILGVVTFVTTYLTVVVVSTTPFSSEDQLRKRRRVATVLAIGASGAVVVDGLVRVCPRRRRRMRSPDPDMSASASAGIADSGTSLRAR